MSGQTGMLKTEKAFALKLPNFNARKAVCLKETKEVAENANYTELPGPIVHSPVLVLITAVKLVEDQGTPGCGDRITHGRTVSAKEVSYPLYGSKLLKLRKVVGQKKKGAHFLTCTM